MNVVRKLALGLLLTGMLTCVAFSAAPQSSGGQTYGKNVFGGEMPKYPAATYVPQPQFQPAQLAQQYTKAEKDEEKKELRKRLTDVLSQQFDQHIQQQQKELEDLEMQIASLRAVLKKRLGSKTAIVERRFEQLVEEASGLGWNVPSNLPRSPYQFAQPSIPK